jgi:hypothetical protein
MRTGISTIVHVFTTHPPDPRGPTAPPGPPVARGWSRLAAMQEPSEEILGVIVRRLLLREFDFDRFDAGVQFGDYFAMASLYAWPEPGATRKGAIVFCGTGWISPEGGMELVLKKHFCPPDAPPSFDVFDVVVPAFPAVFLHPTILQPERRP